jgi:hypothetical protein
MDRTSKKIIKALFKVVAGDVIPFRPIKKSKPAPKEIPNEYKFALKDVFLNGDGGLSANALQKMEKEIDRVSDLIDECDPKWDEDVILNLSAYLDAIVNRVQRSLDTMDASEKEDTRKHIRLLKKV